MRLNKRDLRLKAAATPIKMVLISAATLIRRRRRGKLQQNRGIAS
jgi:hypothetical protein